MAKRVFNQTHNTELAAWAGSHAEDEDKCLEPFRIQTKETRNFTGQLNTTCQSSYSFQLLIVAFSTILTSYMLQLFPNEDLTISYCTFYEQ